MVIYKKGKKDKKEKKDKKDRNEKDSYPFVKISGSEMLFPKISIDDYFNKNHEFRLWLKISEKMYENYNLLHSFFL